MRTTRALLLLTGTLLAMAQVEALATTCFFVFDRHDTVIYRDSQPPVDMSVRGVAARDAMRQRGEFLMFVDTEQCTPLAFITGPGTPGTLTVDQIVGGYTTMMTAPGGAPPASSAGLLLPSAPAAGSRSPSYK